MLFFADKKPISHNIAYSGNQKLINSCGLFIKMCDLDNKNRRLKAPVLKSSYVVIIPEELQ